MLQPICRYRRLVKTVEQNTVINYSDYNIRILGEFVNETLLMYCKGS
jgi:hypothetical protein